MHRFLALLFAGLLAGSTGPLITTIAGLTGMAIAPNPSLATVPATIIVMAITIATIPLALITQRLGRKTVLVAGAIVGSVSCLACATAISAGSFLLLVVAAVGVGVASAVNLSYKFAIAAVAGEKRFTQAHAVALLIGLVSGLIGPFLALRYVGFSAHNYQGSFIAAAVLYAIAVPFLLVIRIPPAQPRAVKQSAPAQPWTVNEKRAVLGMAFCSSTMSMTMTSAPLAAGILSMSNHELGIVMQLHFVAMFVPAILGVALAKRFGLYSMLILGFVLNGGAITLGFPAHDFNLALWCLILSGCSWSIVSLVTAIAVSKSQNPRVEGLFNLTTALATAVGTLAAGIIMDIVGWTGVLLASAMLTVLFSAFAILVGRTAADPELA
ncbi:MAG: MFS transporter [Sphingomonadaceae bacterium]|nr:MFS transporter [Sphingomonadaceae bacterium]